MVQTEREQLGTETQSQVKFSNYPFSLGVASGDPLPDSVILWTRLAPQPNLGGGMPKIKVSVEWQIAEDAQMTSIVKQGTAVALPELAHSVHVDVKELESDRFYWYQFKVGNQISPIGKTRTAPAKDSKLEKLSFAFLSCQDWQNGLYVAYKHLVKEEIDFVLFLGDYIYELAAKPEAVRQHQGGECRTLDEYRARYTQYKMDPYLQAAHAAFAWIATWDDHEVDDNYASFIPNDQQSEQEFRQRRNAAYQAYYENMPVRTSFSPPQEELKIYRQFSFSDLAEIFVLDTRQYRSDQPCGDGCKPRCVEAFDEKATLLGSEQEQWLDQGLSRTKAKWQIIAQQVIMAQFNFDSRSQMSSFNLDMWDGYVAQRNRLLKMFQTHQSSNPIVLAGDFHSCWVNDLKLDFDNPDSPVIATEFVAPAISSGLPAEFVVVIEQALSVNPHVKFFNGKTNGYVICRLSPEFCFCDYRVVSALSDQDATIKTLASFIVESGKPSARKI